MAAVALISGGVRCGKSAFALRWAMAQGPRRTFVATAQAFDGEMALRIRDHQDERVGLGFSTLECPRDLEATLSGVTDSDAIVVDCLTLWLSNLLMLELPDHAIEARIQTLADQLRASTVPTILVTNEVGLGIVPDNALSRRFRDLTGRAHQNLAAVADELYFGVMGRILRLSPGPLELVTL